MQYWLSAWYSGPFLAAPSGPASMALFHRSRSCFFHTVDQVGANMTRDQIQTAINERIPFEIRMADGASYRVKERFQIAVGRTSVVVFDHKDLAHFLPMLTMTGITYLKPDGKV
jgi:hypothetical protein